MMRDLSPLLCLPAAGVLLAACVAGPADRPKASANTGPQSISIDGVAFVAVLSDGPDGIRITGDGASPVAGLTVTVNRASNPLAMDEGALAKKAARLGCVGAGGVFDETALGAHESASGWRFAGACV